MPNVQLEPTAHEQCAPRLSCNVRPHQNDMRAFALYLNGKKIGTAGIGVDGVLSATITLVSGKSQPTSPKRRVASEQIGVALGGLNTETDEHLRWSQRPLRVGDEVCIKVIETESVDIPRHRQRRNRTQELRQQKTYVRQMAKRFGWKILLPQ
jgi:hypothetical protein